MLTQALYNNTPDHQWTRWQSSVTNMVFTWNATSVTVECI